MAGSSADTRIKTILTADSGDFEAGMKRAANALAQAEGKFKKSTGAMDNSLKGFSNSVLGLGAKLGIAFSVGAVVAYGKAIVDLGGQLNDLSAETGIAASTLSALRSGLEQGGSSIEEFAKSAVKLNKNISEAAKGGNKELVKSFDELGLSINRLKRLSPEEQLFEVVQALGEVKDQGDLTRLGMDLFGKSFSGLIPVIKDTNGNLREFTKNALESGDAISDTQVKRLDEFGDSLTRLSIAAENAAAAGLADVLLFLDKIDERTKSIAITVLKMTPLTSGAGYALSKMNEGKAEVQGPPAPPRLKENNKDIRFTSDTDAKAKAVENLRMGIEKMQRDSSRANYTAGFTELEKKLADVDFAAKDLELTYKTKLTPTLQNAVETTKDNVKALYEFEKQQEVNKQLADDLGSAFSDSFRDAGTGAKKFGDIIEDLGARIQSALFNALVTAPLNDFFKAQFSSGGGGAGGIASLFSSAASSIGGFFGLAGGGRINANQPTLVGERGPELFTPRSQGQIIPNAAIGSGGAVNVVVNNNSDAKVTTKTQKKGNSTDLVLQIDQVMAEKINDKGSATHQALNARENRTLTRR